MHEPSRRGTRHANIDALIATIQQGFPSSRIRITGRERTVKRQAELMAERRRQNRTLFLNTYRLSARHITEMDHWVNTHPTATADEAVAAFTEIINQIREKPVRRRPG